MKKIILSALGLLMSLIVSCGDKSNKGNTEKDVVKESVKQETTEVDPMQNKGIGPVKSIVLDPEIDESLAKKGEEVYAQNCLACHKPDKRFVGPAPKGILQRRTPEWIMNMILNPEEMVQKDPIAKALLAEYLSPMANQHLTEEQARAVLEYFRTLK
ncbi:MAG: cytochrome c [Flavobacteriaceae bacterium]|nr:cytochrome c [Flavobacteriaceae bacterium]